MTSLVQRARGTRSITTVDDYLAAMDSFMFNGVTYGYGTGGVAQTQQGQRAEPIANDLAGYASAGYSGSSTVFACMLTRMLVFSGVRFSWQRFERSRPSELFGNQELKLLEEPWVGGTTQDLLVRTILYADLAGNAYWTRVDDELVSLRPDWVQIILEPRRFRGGTLGWKKVGYLYTEGGSGNSESVPLLPDEVAHFIGAQPDPIASYRGMSWLTPVLRELQAAKLMDRHKMKFYENAACPNMVVKMPMLDIEKFKRFKAEMDSAHRGVDNSYKTLFLGGGADVEVVGSNFEQMAFTDVEQAGEVRIAAAAGVPPVIAGLQAGIESSTYSNFSQAKRRFSDGCMHPLWLNAAGSFAPLLRTPSGARLHYDTRDVPFLREDGKDAADIAEKQAATMSSLVMAGYTPESVKRAVLSGDFGLLDHSGLFSVQLYEGGKGPPQDQPEVQPNPVLNGKRETLNAY